MKNVVAPAFAPHSRTLYGRLKRQYFTWVSACGANTRLIRRLALQDRVVVLNLHRVSPHANPFFQPLHPGLLDQLLVDLKRHFRITTFHNLREPETRPSVVLSFDDGYQDFVEYAMPVLAKHGVKVNFNVCPAYLLGQPNWDVRLVDFLNAAPLSLVNEIRLPGFHARLVGDGYDCRLNFGLSLLAYLKRLERTVREDLWCHIEATLRRPGSIKETRLMTVADTLEAARVHEVGAHSYNHELMGLESDDFFRKDIDRCKHFFRERLNCALKIYAFPSGSYRPEQVEILRSKGVGIILTSAERYARRQDSLFPRILLYGDSAVEVGLRALGYKPSPLLTRIAALGRVLPTLLGGALGRRVPPRDNHPQGPAVAASTTSGKAD